MVITVVGIGLIGGSMAIALKEKGIASKMLGVENNPVHQQKALERGLVDEILPLEKAVVASDVIILTTPVNVLQHLVPAVLDLVENQVVMDAGSTKSGILELIKTHPKRGRFVATHPMWG